MGIVISGCQGSNGSIDTSTSADGIGTTSVSNDLTSVIQADDYDQDYDLDAATLNQLDQDSATCIDPSVSIDGSLITINAEGIYRLSGSLSNGSIIIDAKDKDVQLILDDVDITSDNYGAIVIDDANKVKITLASGTTNTLTNTNGYTLVDDSNVDGVIFSKSDLTINGDGSLIIHASEGHGIVCKDSLVITNGNYIIDSASHGIDVKDSIGLTNASFDITSGKDGIHVENEDDTTLGYLYIQDGSFTITSEGDGISASNALVIDDGDFTIFTGEGSSSVDLSTLDNAMDRMGFASGKGMDRSVAESDNPVTLSPTLTTTMDSTSDSQKGIKAEGGITINNGGFTIDSVDDCIHSGASLYIYDGSYDLSSGDDAIHSDMDLIIDNGTFTIPYCYEGIEGLSVTINGGTIDITSSDDGINAAGGNDQSGFGPRQDFENTADTNASFITINAGTITIVANGDGIDSNGALTINGGTIDVTSNGNGDTALDCDGEYINNGGTIITNDGSESDPNAMDGAMGHGGNQRPMDDGSLPMERPMDDGSSLHGNPGPMDEMGPTNDPTNESV